MNRRHQRTLDAIFATPTPATLEWPRNEIGRRTTEDGRDFLTNAGVKP